MPSLSASNDNSWGPGGLVHYGFDSELTNFDRDLSNISNCTAPVGIISPCVTGWRMSLSPTASLNIAGPGYFVRPAVTYSATQYELRNTQLGEDKSPSRTLPIASLDTGLQFERDIGAAANRKLTLEPRMLYLYAPYRNQNDLPVFDTALPDLVPVELFRNNRYVGSDRVSDADQVAMGVTSRLLDGHDGRQFLAVTFGQIYYFETPRVVLPYEVPQTGIRSDFITQLEINAFKNWNSNLGLQWNPAASQFERADVNIQYKPAADKVINIAYRFERGTIHPASQCNIDDANATGATATALTAAEYSQAGICGFEQLEVSGAWPIAGHWNAFAREVYSLPGQATAGEFRRLRVRFVLLAGSLRGTPIHQQASVQYTDHGNGSPGPQRVAAVGTHGPCKCRICIGYLPDRRDSGLYPGHQLAKIISKGYEPALRRRKASSCAGFCHP